MKRRTIRGYDPWDYYSGVSLHFGSCYQVTSDSEDKLVKTRPIGFQIPKPTAPGKLVQKRLCATHICRTRRNR